MDTARTTDIVRIALTARSMGKLVMSSLDRADLFQDNIERTLAHDILRSDRYTHCSMKVTKVEGTIQLVFSDFGELKWSKTVKTGNDQVARVLQHIIERLEDKAEKQRIRKAIMMGEVIVESKY